MDYSKKVTRFRVSFSDDFEDRSFVERVISDWNSGANSFILRTSGSTGLPKEITLSREMLEWSAVHTLIALHLEETELHNHEIGILCCLPVHRTGGFMQIIRALCWGCHIKFEKPIGSPSPYFEGQCVFMTSLTPMQIENMTAEGLIENRYMKILVGGAAISEQLESVIVQNELNVYETYGMTETASHIALRKVGSQGRLRPHEGVELTEVDSVLRICIPQLNFEIMTNDLVRFYEDGFELEGRVDDVINSGGLKIYPNEIEPLIFTVFEGLGMKNSFYLSKNRDEKLGDKTVLVIEGEAIANTEELLKLLKNVLPKYHNPREVIFVKKIEYTDTGKVIRIHS